MKICIYGPGAIGGLFAARLASSGANVNAIARGATLDAVKREGLTLIEQIDGLERRRRFAVNATSDPVEIEIDGVDERYTSSATWACEAKDASGILPVLKWCGVDIAIHGRSLIAAILPEFAAPVERLAVAA